MAERADETQAYRILRTQESKIIDRYRVTDGEKFRLKDHDPADTAGHQSVATSPTPLLRPDVGGNACQNRPLRNAFNVGRQGRRQTNYRPT